MTFVSGAGISSYHAEYLVCPDAGDVLLGTGLDQGVVADGAAGVDTAAADADPVRGVLGLARLVLARQSGTVQLPATSLNCLPPCAIEPWL